MSCKNMVDQTVPTRFSAKIVTLKCGSTGIDGSPIYCQTCRENGAVSKPAYTYEDAGEADFESWEEPVFRQGGSMPGEPFDDLDEEDLENLEDEIADKIERRSGHDFNADAVCLKCGFDGAEWSHLNRTAYRDEPRPAPVCDR